MKMLKWKDVIMMNILGRCCTWNHGRPKSYFPNKDSIYQQKCSNRINSFSILLSSAMFLVLLFFLLFCLKAVLFGNDNKEELSSQNAHSMNKYYTSICIQDGDTLWELAEFYTKGGSERSIKKFVREVKVLNNLSSDTIYADSYLVIPYYEAIENDFTEISSQ